ncbi:hypothetical protein Tco_0394645 [Tanacetum coccineum]
MIEDYNHQISFRADPLLITKISYIVNQHKEATMKIVRDNDPLNLISLRAKFQWIVNQEKRLGLPPPPALATFGMTPEEKKRKRKELIKEVFLTKDVRVDRMGRNLIPPLGVLPIQGLVIKEPELSVEGPDSKSNVRRIHVKDIVKEVEDHLKTYSSAGMDISCDVTPPDTYSAQAPCGGVTILECKLVLVDDDGKPLENVDYPDISDSDYEVEPVENETTNFWHQRKLDMVRKTLCRQYLIGYNIALNYN